MKQRVTKWIAVIGLTVIALTGCTSESTEQINTLNDKLVQLEEDNKKLETSIIELQQQVDTLTNENNSLLLEIENLTKGEYALYSRDVDTWEIVEVDKVRIDKNESIEKKLQLLANGLSASQFDNLVIEVKEITKVNGENIAVIDLKDEGKGDNTWIARYFQGSTGAEMTRTALEETFLQKDIQENWVDGIRILYNGTEASTDHMSLGTIIYRNH